MRPVLLVALAVLNPAAAFADPCTDEIAGLFEGGAFDPFVRPNRREITVQVQPDGTETPLNEVLWDGTLKSINHQNGVYYMAIGTKAWQASLVDGPWTFSGDMGDFDPDEMTRATNRSMAANLSETECPGVVDLEGQRAVKYVFRTKTDPNRFGSWWGGLYTAYVDPRTGLKLREDIAEYVASWAPDPAQTVNVTVVEYDDTISIEAPAE